MAGTMNIKPGDLVVWNGDYWVVEAVNLYADSEDSIDLINGEIRMCIYATAPEKVYRPVPQSNAAHLVRSKPQTYRDTEDLDLIQRLRSLAAAEHDDLSIAGEAADRLEELL